MSGELYLLACPFPAEALTEAGKVALLDGAAHFRHQRLVVKKVVDGIQPRAENFADAVQVVQVGAREIAAGLGRRRG